MPEAKITVSAQDLASDAMKKVQASVGDLGDSARHLGESATEWIERPFESAKGALSGFAETLGPVGIGVTAVAGVLLTLGEHAMEAGEALENFSYKTGISVEAASGLQFAAEATGSSLDQLGNAIFMMQRQMELNPDQFAQGLARIHLSIADIESLSPDQKFLAIADAFRQNTDESNRAAAAVELFSRSGRDLTPTLMKPLQDLTAQASDLGITMSTEAAQGAEELKIKLNELKAEVGWYATGAGLKILEFFDDLNTRAAQLQALTAGPKEFDEIWKDVAGDMPKVRDNMQDLVAQGYKPMIASSLEAEHASRQLTESARASMEENKKAADALREYRAAGQDYDDLILKVGNDTYEGIAYDHARGISVETLARTYDIEKTSIEQVIKFEEQAKQELDAHVAAIGRFEAEGTKAAEAVAKSFGGNLDVLQHLSVQLGDTTLAGTQFNEQVLLPMPDLAQVAAQHMRDLVSTIGDDLKQALESIPGTLASAFTGGGGLLGGIESIGSQVGSALGKHIGSAIAALGSFGGPIGAAIGSLAGPLIGAIANIGGPSKEEVQGRQTEGQFEQQMGGIAGLGKALTDAGLSADAANAKILALFAAEKSGSAAVQTQIDSINGLIKQHATDVSTGVQSILDAAKSVGSNFPAALKPMLDELTKLPGLTDDERKALQGLEDGGKPSLSDLTSTASKYGMTLDELGPKTQQLDISTKADQVAKDFKMLVDSGADYGDTVNHFSGQISGLVQEAMKYGGTLPTSLQPIAEALVNAGELTDDTGKKITDLSGIKFDDTNDPLATGMKNLTDALNHLSDLFKNQLPNDAKTAASEIAGALGSIQVPEVHVPVVYDTPGGPSAPARAGGDDPSGMTQSIRAGLAGAATRSAAASGYTPADFHAAVATAMKPLANRLDMHFRSLPMLMRHAMRGTR